MTLSIHSKKLVEFVKNNPTLIKDESIVDAITGLHRFCSLNEPYLVSIFGMDGYVTNKPIGLLLTQTRMILYYEDVAGNHQFRMYPLNQIENIVLTKNGLIFKEDKVELYMSGAYVSLFVKMGEDPGAFVDNTKKLMNQRNDMDNGNFIYCIKCGTKLPGYACFCLKCGTKCKLEE